MFITPIAGVSHLWSGTSEITSSGSAVTDGLVPGWVASHSLNGVAPALEGDRWFIAGSDVGAKADPLPDARQRVVQLPDGGVEACVEDHKFGVHPGSNCALSPTGLAVLAGLKVSPARLIPRTLIEARGHSGQPPRLWPASGLAGSQYAQSQSVLGTAESSSR